MKALRFYDVQDLRYEDAPDPVIEKPDDVIVKVKAVGICGSDIARYRNLGPYVPGNVWGHEFCGEVVEVGEGVKNLKPGDRVVGCPNMVCHECEYCKSGHPSRCENLNTIGAYVPGAYAEYIKLPEINFVKMADSMSYEQGALVEPATVAIHGLYQTSIKMGYEVAVVGCGNIGLMAIAWAKAFGAKRVFAIDIDDAQLQLAKEFGADVLINSTDIDFHDEIRKYGNGVDLAIESAGNPFTAARVLGLPHKGGEVVYMGIPYADVPIPRFYFERIMRNELHVIGSWCTISAPYPGKEWTNAVEYIGSGKVDVLGMVTHQVNLSEGPEMFKKIKEHKRIFVYGTGRSGLMLKAFAMRLMQIGLNSYVVGETTTPSVQEGDLLIVASASGETGSVCMTAESAVKQGVDLIVISSAPESTLGKIHAPDIEIEAATKFATSKVSVQPLGSLFEQMLLMVFDTIILEMSEEKEGSNEDMAKRHASLE